MMLLRSMDDGGRMVVVMVKEDETVTYGRTRRGE
jgi:hypothetical protein